MSDAAPTDPRSYHAQFEIAMIVACARNGVIGRDGDLPWHLSEDLKHFMRSTRGCPVVMGRKTYESLDGPLPSRLNVVVSNSMKDPARDGVKIVSGLDEAIAVSREAISAEQYQAPIWIAGGGTIYEQMLDRAGLVVRTLVESEPEGDAYFPDLPATDWALRHQVRFEEDERHEFPFMIQWLSRLNRD